MFKIGDYIVSRNSGVCVVNGIEQKDFGMGLVDYYSLKPCFSKSSDSTVFIPVSRANIILRYILSKSEVLDVIKEMPSMEKVWITDPKVRRQKFDEIYKTGTIKEQCQLARSLYLQNQELKANKKSLSMIDKELFDKITNNINNEFAIVLGIKPEEVENFINTYND